MFEVTLCVVQVLALAIATVSSGLLTVDDEKVVHTICGVLLIGGAIGGLLGIMDSETSVATMFCSILSGMLCSQLLYLLCKIVQQERDEDKIFHFYDDGQPPRYYITGDKHRHFDHVIRFCQEQQTRRKDVLIVLGDAGLNYYGDERDEELKSKLAQLPITLFCIHGNKENRPQNVGSYGVRNFCGGKVYYEPRYPNLLFAIDGGIYTFDGRDYLVVGGAHSVDKLRCLEENHPYWEDETPDELTKVLVEQKLQMRNNQIYGVLTHTCPLKYLPTEMFLSNRKVKSPKKFLLFRKAKTFMPDVERSTEEWLDRIEDDLSYETWFCGHYHVDKSIDKVIMMHKDIRPLYADNEPV